MDDRLITIIDEVKRTNGRVNVLEEKETNHTVNCPQKTRFEIIEAALKIEHDQNEFWRVAKAHPKLFLSGIFAIAGMVALTVIGALMKIGFIF
ncbi:MAG: hypothetical protein HC831_21670 [Chloroflexia bacterium]|nr:hypothetical protein [Chloroflexia bacterium]